MKRKILLGLSLIILLLLTGCSTEYRSVLDCKQCNADEFCKDIPNGWNEDKSYCVLYGDNKKPEGS